MTKKLYEELTIKAIADAIRERNGSTTKYLPTQMPNAIRTLSLPLNLESLHITENGTYVPGLNKDGFNEVTVEVEKILIPKSIFSNGTFNPADDNADGYSSITVNIIEFADSLPLGIANSLFENMDMDMDLLFSNNCKEYILVRSILLSSLSFPDLGLSWSGIAEENIT